MSFVLFFVVVVAGPPVLGFVVEPGFRGVSSGSGKNLPASKEMTL